MNADNTQEWPNQRLKVMIPMWTLLALSTIFLAWRIAYGFAQRRRFMLSDYLLIIAAVSTAPLHPTARMYSRTLT